MAARAVAWERHNERKSQGMEVRDGMSGVVLTVGPGHTLREAARMMTERGVGAAVVIDEEMPAPGVVSERDVINSLGRGEDPDIERVGAHRTRLGDLARRPTGASSARRSRCPAATSATWWSSSAGELVGVLSMRDIMRVWTSEGATSSMTSPESEAASV